MWRRSTRAHCGRCAQVLDNQVLQVKPERDKAGRVGVQVGSGWRKPKNLRNTQLGHFARAGVEPKQYVAEFRVSPDAVLPVGLRLHPYHLVAGQMVDTSALSCVCAALCRRPGWCMLARAAAGARASRAS